MLNYIAEVGVFLVCEVFESVEHPGITGLVHTSGRHGIALLVLIREIEPKTKYNNHQKRIAAQVRCECNKIPWLVPVKKHLWTWLITCQYLLFGHTGSNPRHLTYRLRYQLPI